MGKSLTKIVYKPDPNATDVFLVIVDPVEFKKWKEGGYTIPLVSVLDSFEIFSSNQGSQGLLGRPSKQELDNVFGTHTDTDVVLQILEKGKEEAGDSITSGKWASRNDTKGSAVVDSRGGHRTTGI
ncbi:FYSH domain-containing protein [Auriscalpium vulgare]|uniref:FYSH domain-containing protein n=1 Tax=Auriscalpium vulgare TaxID=40419 RepID=A0ACB8SC39_9AGAM|nr:FYSH domain-containing protein [Auriscalpium vulgare]